MSNVILKCEITSARFQNDHHIIAERLLKHIDSCKRVDKNGSVSFSPDFSFDGYQEVLQDILVLSQGVPHNEFGRIVWLSLVNSAKEGRITSDIFLRHASELEKEYLSRQPKHYILVSEISISSNDDLPRFRVGSSTISFPKKLPTDFLHGRAEVLEKAKYALHAATPENYRWVRVTVNSKGDGAAANTALDALHLLLGVWNLSLNSGSRVSWGGKREPVNTVTLGPIHTVHFLSGKLEREVWWFDPNYCGPITPRSLGKDIERIVQFWYWVKRRLLKVPYRNQLEEWIRLYNQALDEKDWSTSYIRLWQVLETATNTSNGNHQVTVRRVAFLYADREFNHAFIDHLRNMRNQLVHESADKSTMESHLFLLKNYVETLLLFHLKQAGQFRTLGEVSEFLDLPTSIVDLTKRSDLFKKAIRFREPVIPRLT